MGAHRAKRIGQGFPEGLPASELVRPTPPEAEEPAIPDGRSSSIVVVPGGLAEKSTKTDHFRKAALDPIGIALVIAHRKQVEEWVAKAAAAHAAAESPKDSVHNSKLTPH